MVINELQHDLDKLRSRGLKSILFVQLAVILGFGIWGQRIEDTQASPVIVLILSLYLSLRFIGDWLFKKGDLVTLEDLKSLKPFNISFLYFVTHLGLILSAIIFCLIFKKYLNIRLNQQHPQTKLTMQLQQIDELYSRLVKTSKITLNLTYQNLKLLNYRLKQNNPISNIKSLLNLISYNNKIIYKNLDNLVNNNKNLLISIVKRLNCVNPLEILARGYSILEDSQGKIVQDKSQVVVGSVVTAKLHHGLLICKIETIE